MPLPIVVFGAFDRHNLGDLLLAHVAEALLPGRVGAFAGLATRDLRAEGGHAVQALHELAARWTGGPAVLWHAGGELLSCRAWHAAVMLQHPADIAPSLPYLQRRPSTRAAWARRVLATASRAPYVAGRSRFPPASRVVFCGVGGVGLPRASAALQAEVRAQLADADAVGVRDGRTAAWLHAQGIAARLMPDPALAVADLFGPRIGEHGERGEIARLRRDFPQGWIAFQCSAVFGDDQTLETLAAALTRLAERTGAGIVLWRAGAAPWHDDSAVLQRLAARLGTRRWRLLHTLHNWELCALVARARLVVASSLHARLVACAFARPRVTVAPPLRGDPAAKHRAVIEAWDGGPMPGVVAADELDSAMARALALAQAPATATEDRARAAALAARVRSDVDALLARLT